MENVVFLILVVVFLAILFIFVARQGSNDAVLEEQLAKQIALMIDEAEPETLIHLRVEDFFEESDNPKIIIEDNVVTVKLANSGPGYSYGYFNSVNVEDKIEDIDSGEFQGRYLVLTIR